MAVLGATARFMDVELMLRGLKATSASVVCLRTGTVTSSAFFVASDIVMLPAFVLRRGFEGLAARDLVFVHGRKTWQGAETPEILDAAGDGTKEETSVALIRVRGRSQGQPLGFALEPPSIDSQVAVVQYPLGQNECAVSIGRVLESDDPLWIAYDADTAGGSSGSPVLDAGWNVVAMHHRFNANRNEGLSRAFLVDLLRQSRYWPQLVEEHGFAEISQSGEPADPAAAKKKGPSALLRRAALSPVIKPRSLSAAQRGELKALIANPASPAWVLPVSERRAIIDAAGSLAALRRHRRRSRHPAESVIDSIFEGPPYTHKKADEEELGWWIQVVRWFEGIVPDLPSPAELATTLERRRLRSRLERVAGPDFQGRSEDIKALKAWYRKGGPLMVMGVGGVGKSALLATFALDLPDDTLLLWLDFDRADLAPDDAGSVLSALTDQLRVQRGEAASTPADASDDWKPAARRLGADIAAAGGDSILVLDSFEAAQYSDRYQELWPVLEAVTAAAPNLRVCVTGRAEVPGLTLNGRAAESLPLRGLSEEAAKSWLRKHDIVEPKVLEPVLRIAQGIPLILRLALRYLETGGRMQDLPSDLPDAVISGYLYRRILNRVHDPAIHPLASRVLILRRFSEDMLTPVFKDLVEFPPGEPADWAMELRREKSLFDGSGELRLRGEVRAATLALLERETPDIVREVDGRAAAWYAGKTDLSVEDSAELVYHRLRLGAVEGAAEAWREGCGAFLTYAEEELRDEAARAWLHNQLGAGGGQSLEEWEYDASRRIADARARGLQRAVAGILLERPDRSARSPLAFEEGYELWRSGQLVAAQTVLARRSAAQPQDPRCTALLALLDMRKGDCAGAETLLGTLDRSAWLDRPEAEYCDLAVQAARIRLTVDLLAEETLLAQYPHPRAMDIPPPTQGVLAPVDVMLPRLADLFASDEAALESIGPEFDPAVSGYHDLLGTVRHGRGRRSEQDWDLQATLLERWSAGQTKNVPVASGFRIESSRPDLPLKLASYLADLSLRRWWLAAFQGFLRRITLLSFDSSHSRVRTHDGIVATMMLLMARLTAVDVRIFGVPFGDFILKSPWYRMPFEVGEDDWPRIWTILRYGVSEKLHLPPANVEKSIVVTIEQLVSGTDRRATHIEAACLAYYLLADDPLETLIHRLANPSPDGVPHAA
jgi:hypothetical protein